MSLGGVAVPMPLSGLSNSELESSELPDFPELRTVDTSSHAEEEVDLKMEQN
jgi:hypothetical protein